MDFAALGGGRVHAETSGVAHFLASDEPQALENVRRLLSYLPQNDLDDVPCAEEREPALGVQTLDAIVPDDPQRSYEMHGVIAAIIDADSLLEVHTRNAICGFARVGGERSEWSRNSPTFSPEHSTSMRATTLPASSRSATASTSRSSR